MISTKSDRIETAPKSAPTLLRGLTNSLDLAFDRWLEQVKAEAWDEGHHAGQHNEHEHRPGRAMTNPYRQETQA